MSAMIERVARAIHDSYWAEDWDGMHPNGVQRAAAFQQARAAIEAVRTAPEGHAYPRAFFEIIEAILREPQP